MSKRRKGSGVSEQLKALGHKTHTTPSRKKAQELAEEIARQVQEYLDEESQAYEDELREIYGDQ